jgi:hypothetical protein
MTLYQGAAELLGDEDLFGVNVGGPNEFTGAFGMAEAGGNTKQGFTCFLEQVSHASVAPRTNAHYPTRRRSMATSCPSSARS